MLTATSGAVAAWPECRGWSRTRIGWAVHEDGGRQTGHSLLCPKAEVPTSSADRTATVAPSPSTGQRRRSALRATGQSRHVARSQLFRHRGERVVLRIRQIVMRDVRRTFLNGSIGSRSGDLLRDGAGAGRDLTMGAILDERARRSAERRVRKGRVDDRAGRQDLVGRQQGTACDWHAVE